MSESAAANANAPLAPTRASAMRLSDAKTIGEALQTAQFQRAVADAAPQHMTAQRLMATFRQAARNNPAFNQCNLLSVLGVFMTCTFLGLEPNTPQGHAYMIPFKKRRFDRASRQMVDDGYDLQLIIGYQGYLDLAYRSPRVSSVAAHAVYEGDDFSFEYGSNEHLQHRPKGLHSDTDAPRYFYMFSKLTGGQAFEVLPYAKVIQIRNGSQGYQAAVAAKERAEKEGWKIPAAYTETPWVKHFTAMGQKTAMRAGYKWLPKTVEMAAVARLEDTQDRGLIDFGPVLEGHVNPLDEDLPLIHEPRAEPGAAFGERQHDDDGVILDQQPAQAQQQEARRDPLPARTTPAAREAPSPAAPPTQAPPPPPTQAPPPPPSQPAFAAHMADATGEIHDRIGDAGYVTDPVVFAAAYVELWAATPPDSRQALAEHNADALQDAVVMSEKAANILAAMNTEPAPETLAAPIGPVAIEVVTKDGKPDLKGYIAALRDAAAAQTAESFPAWDSLQRPVIVTLAKLTRATAEKIVADRAAALGTTKPPAAAPQGPVESQGTQEPPPDDVPPPTGDDQPAGEPGPAEGAGLLGEPIPPKPWSRLAQDIYDQLRQCATAHDIQALATNAAVAANLNKILAADPDEHARLRAFAQARRAELAPSKPAGG